MHICTVYSGQSQLLQAGKEKNEKRRGETQTPAIQTVTRSIVAAENKKKKKRGEMREIEKAAVDNHYPNPLKYWQLQSNRSHFVLFKFFF